MVIGRRFAWAHLPKAAGDATCTMLQAVPGLVLFADPLDSNDKHMPFFGREAEVADKELVMNIRRLPEWVVSGAQHRSRHGEYPDYRRVPFPPLDVLSQTRDADNLLRWMTDHGRFEVGHWLRAEQLEDDVLALLDELGELTSDGRDAVRAVGRINKGTYDHDLASHFTDQQIRRLYELNPDWAAIERRVYGEVRAGSTGAGPAGERPHLDR